MEAIDFKVGLLPDGEAVDRRSRVPDLSVLKDDSVVEHMKHKPKFGKHYYHLGSSNQNFGDDLIARIASSFSKFCKAIVHGNGMQFKYRLRRESNLGLDDFFKKHLYSLKDLAEIVCCC